MPRALPSLFCLLPTVVQSPSGLIRFFTQQSPQSTLNQAFLHFFASNPNQSLGRLVLQAKAGTTDTMSVVPGSFLVNPAMKIQFAPTVTLQKLLRLPLNPSLLP